MKAAEINQRRKEITAMLYEAGEVKVSELVSHYSVSDETIRKDLAYLASEGLLKKQYGKAVLTKSKPLAPVSSRTPVNEVLKMQIVAAASGLIDESVGAIGLDQGSTVALLASQLWSFPPKDIFTGSLASILQLTNTDHRLHCFGGLYDQEDMVFRNDSSQEMYPDIRFDLCIFGSSGVLGRSGFCTSSLNDAQTKRMMLAKASRSVVLLDETKFQTSSLVQVADWSQVDLVITTPGIPPEQAKLIRENCELIIAEK